MPYVSMERLRETRCEVPEHDYSNRGGRVQFAVNGRYLRMRFKPSQADEWNQEMFWRPSTTRGICKGFSRASRRTFLDKLNQVDNQAPLPYFVTLTFPDECFLDSVTEFAKVAKRHLDVWFKRLHRVAPEAAAFWKLEWKARKSGSHLGKLFPHFHLLIWGLEEREFVVSPSFAVVLVDGRRVRVPVPSFIDREAFVRSEDYQGEFRELLCEVSSRIVFDSKSAA